MSTPKAVVLLSGGLDSATVLAMMMSQGFDAYAMSFRYGQRHIVELEKAKEVARQLGARRAIIVDIDLRAFGGSALTSDIAVPKGRSAADMSHGHPQHVRPRAQYDLLELRPCLGGSRRLRRYLRRRQRARLLGLS